MSDGNSNQFDYLFDFSKDDVVSLIQTEDIISDSDIGQVVRTYLSHDTDTSALVESLAYNYRDLGEDPVLDPTSSQRILLRRCREINEKILKAASKTKILIQCLLRVNHPDQLKSLIEEDRELIKHIAFNCKAEVICFNFILFGKVLHYLIYLFLNDCYSLSTKRILISLSTFSPLVFLRTMHELDETNSDSYRIFQLQNDITCSVVEAKLEIILKDPNEDRCNTEIGRLLDHPIVFRALARGCVCPRFMEKNTFFTKRPEMLIELFDRLITSRRLDENDNSEVQIEGIDEIYKISDFISCLRSDSDEERLQNVDKILDAVVTPLINLQCDIPNLRVHFALIHAIINRWADLQEEVFLMTSRLLEAFKRSQLHKEIIASLVEVLVHLSVEGQEWLVVKLMEEVKTSQEGEWCFIVGTYLQELLPIIDGPYSEWFVETIQSIKDALWANCASIVPMCEKSEESDNEGSYKSK
ncbi:hypothetical protein ACOME3_003386 [Neoechinorhynchus agilis]